jgi:hypothetical protein
MYPYSSRQLEGIHDRFRRLVQIFATETTLNEGPVNILMAIQVISNEEGENGCNGVQEQRLQGN